MRALIYAKSNPVVDKLVKELAHTGQNIRFSETASYQEALSFYTEYKPEIIILDLEGLNGNGNNFLKKVKEEETNIHEVILAHSPSTRIILTNTPKSELTEK